MESVRPLTLDELGTLISWAESEGWNPGLDDAEAFFNADPGGYFGAFVDEKLVAGVSVVKSGEQHGFLGLYLCHPQYRGQGHGWRVWQAGMQYLQGRSIGLDGVVDQQANYRRSGFELAYRNIRYLGAPPANSIELPKPWKIRASQVSHLSELLKLDLAAHGVNRESFMRSWLDVSVASRYTAVLELDGAVQGFGTIRRCKDQCKIGPLILSNTDALSSDNRLTAANALIRSLADHFDASQVVIDIPETNLSAMEIAQQLQLEPIFETARMYRGKPPASDVQQIFGVTTLELG